MEKIKLYSIYTDETRILRDIFLKSIKDDWEIDISYWGKVGEGEGDTWTPGWYEILEKRISFLIDKIKENWNEIIIWADIDIQFFGKCSRLINKRIIDKDILFLSEHWPKKEINGGFIVMRCNPKTLLFFESVLQSDIENLKYGDQSAMNNILRENIIDIKWDILPRQFWARSHSVNPPIDIVLHHANCTMPLVENDKKIGSMELKIKQLQRIKEYIVLRRRWKWLFYFKDLIQKFNPKNIKL